MRLIIWAPMLRSPSPLRRLICWIRLPGSSPHAKSELGAMTDAPHILIVDDDEQVVRYMQTTLVENGYNVTATTSGWQALDMIDRRKPDLLILDLNMPGP